MGAYRQSAAARAYAEYNAGIANLQAQDALRVGDERAAQIRRQADQATGAVRAGYAGRGVDVSAGTPAEVAYQTEFFGQADEATARTNAGREAWALRARAAGFQSQADAENPLLAAGSTFLGTASQVAGKWYEYGGRNPLSRGP